MPKIQKGILILIKFFNMSNHKKSKNNLDNMFQCVSVTLTDGRVFSFTGKAFCREDDILYIEKIEFTQPEPIPEGCSFEIIKK